MYADEERVLDGVLGLLRVPEHVPAERQDAAMVAVVDHLERGRAAFANQRDQVAASEASRSSCGDDKHPCRRQPRHRARFHERHYR